MYGMKLTDSPNCDCGLERQTVDHVILRCEHFKIERLCLKLEVLAIWENSKKSGNLQMDIRLLLNPRSNSNINLEEAKSISESFGKFLRSINFKF